MKPNHYGVYESPEIVNLPLQDKKWHKAQILLACDDNDKQWRYAYEFQTNSSGGGGLPRKNARKLFDSRDDVIKAAIDEVINRFPELHKSIIRSDLCKYLQGQMTLF
jgi:hypothetical protein